MKKRFFSLLMVLVMLMSLIPSTAFAAGGESNAANAVTYSERTVKSATDDAVFVGTDVHGSTGDLGTILSTVSGDGIAYTVIGGDIVSDTSSSLSTYTAAITNVLTNLSTEDCYFTYGSHDSNMTTTGTNGFLDSASTGAVDLGTAWLWGISYGEMTDSSSASTAAAAFTNWVNGLASDDHRAIIIMSHVPMHARRNDNPGGATWPQQRVRISFSSGVTTIPVGERMIQTISTLLPAVLCCRRVEAARLLNSPMHLPDLSENPKAIHGQVPRSRLKMMRLRSGSTH